MREFLAVLAIILLPSINATAASAADLKLLSPQAMKPALSELAPQFERSSGHRVITSYASAAALTKRLEAGEVADVSILLVSNAQITVPRQVYFM